MAGLKEIEGIKKALSNSYNNRKNLLELYKSKTIDYLRSNYKDFMNENDDDINIMNRSISALETLKSKANQQFQDGFTIINNTIN